MNRTLAAAKQGPSNRRHWDTWEDFQVEGRPWFSYWAGRVDGYRAHVAVLDSMAASGLFHQFVYSWGGSNRALWVALPSDGSNLRDEIEVCDPYWSKVPENVVRIKHEAFTGLTDSMERPIADAVPLFWRFVSEKFGIEFPRNRLSG